MHEGPGRLINLTLDPVQDLLFVCIETCIAIHMIGIYVEGPFPPNEKGLIIIRTSGLQAFRPRRELRTRTQA